MDQWAVLGIDPTRDQQKIRRAYAQRSRECHPEEHPQEFQELYAAYQWAMDRAKRMPASTGEKPRGLHNKFQVPVYKEEYTPPTKRPLPPLPPFGRQARQAVLSPAKKKEGDLEFEAVFARADELRQQEAQRYRETGPARAFLTWYGAESKERTKTWWEEYFLTKEFLDAQMDPLFLSFLEDFLEERERSPQPPTTDLYRELYIAYGFGEYAQTGMPPRELQRLYELTTRRDPDGLFGVRRREYVPRVECFLIYHRLLRQARQEGFSPIGWEKALQGANSAYTGSRRHPSVYRLLTYFVDTHPGLPAEVWPVFYRKFELSGFERSSTKQKVKPLYEALKRRLDETAKRKDQARQEAMRRIKFAFRALCGQKEEAAAQDVEAFFASKDFQTLQWDEEFLEFLTVEASIGEMGSPMAQGAYRAYQGAKIPKSAILLGRLESILNH